MNIFKILTMRNAHGMNPNKAAKRLATKSARKALKQEDLNELIEESTEEFILDYNSEWNEELPYTPNREI